VDTSSEQHPVVLYLEERRREDAERRASRRRRVVISGVVGLVLVGVGIAGRQAIESAPGVTNTSSTGAIHVCTKPHYDASVLTCTQDTHALNTHDAADAQVSIEFHGVQKRHFLGVQLFQLAPNGRDWKTAIARTTIPNLQDGVQDLPLTEFITTVSVSGGDGEPGRYRLRCVIDQKLLTDYQFDVYVEPATSVPGGS